MSNYRSPYVSEKNKAPKSSMKFILKYGIALILTFALIGFLENNVIETFSIPSGSMMNTLEINDQIIVDRLVPNTIPLHRGDAVVFKDPSNWLPVSDKPNGVGYLVKRVIAVGGDTISCCDAQGNLLLNGKPLNEPYIKAGDVPSQIKFNEKVPQGTVWVMGDNRSNSKDSRLEGGSISGKFVPAKDIVGKAFAIIWPYDRINFI